MKPRIGAYLSKRTAARLTSAAKRRGMSKSALVETAINHFLDASDADNTVLLADRLAGLSEQIGQLDRDLGIVSEIVGLHARFHLAATAPVAAPTHGSRKCPSTDIDNSGANDQRNITEEPIAEQETGPGWRTSVRAGSRFLLEYRALIVRVFLPFVAGYYLSYLFRAINALIAAPLASDLALGAADLGSLPRFIS